MSILRCFGFTVVCLFACGYADQASAQWYSGNYNTFYAPYTSYYGGSSPAGSGCCGSGSYTSYYGGFYGGNPFAPLVPGPGYGWGRGYYTAGYAPLGYGGGCGCAPCGTGCSPCSGGGCSTGNCGLTTNRPSEPLKPEPESNGNIPKTYDDEEPRTFEDRNSVPMDDPGFRESNPGSGGSEEDAFPGGIDSFKVPMEEGDAPANQSQPIVPLDANPTASPELFDLDLPQPITPRNSAQLRPRLDLEERMTWRSSPVLVPSRQSLPKSRPLVVRKTIRTLPRVSVTIVSQSESK